MDPLVDFSFNMASSNALLNQIMQTQQFEFKTRDMVVDLSSQVKHYDKYFKNILMELKEIVSPAKVICYNARARERDGDRDGESFEWALIGFFL